MAVDIINNLRIIEDSAGFILLTLALIYLIYAAIKMKNSIVGYIPFSLTIGLLPLYIWKGMGTFKRAFVDKAVSPEIYTFLDKTGEMFEAFSGLVLAIVFVYILLKLKGIIGKKEESKVEEPKKEEVQAEAPNVEKVAEEKTVDKKHKPKK